MVIGVAVAGSMISCKQKSADQTKAASYEDTVGLSQFQSWKAQNETADPSEYNKAGATSAGAAQTAVKPASKPAAAAPVYTTTQPAAAEKKGWSKAAKGTVIGAGSGAIIGAVVNKKNRAAGAVIGGVVGGGAGYGIGRAKDKKDGRVQ